MKQIFWGQPNKTNVVRRGEWIVPQKAPVPAPVPDFHGITYDPDTYEMLGIGTGVGDLITTHSTTLYAADKDGIYQQYNIDEPVYTGGRVTLSGGAGSLVDKVYADDGSGNLLPELPYLQHYETATNELPNSRDLTTGWQPTAAVVSYDQTGLAGEPNTASLVTNNSNTDFTPVRNFSSQATAAFQTVAVAYILKDQDETRFPLIRTWSAAADQGVVLNTKTGAIVPSDNFNSGTDYAIEDVGLWWKLIIEIQKVHSDVQWQLHPAYNNDGSGAQGDGTDTGSVIVGNAEIHYDKTINEVKHLGPIFTTTVAVTASATTYDTGAANHNDIGCYYMEVDTIGGDTAILAGFLSVASIVFKFSDGVSSAERPYSSAKHRIGLAFAEAQMAINVDGVWSTDEIYDGSLLVGALDYFRAGGFPGAIREVRRYDEATYAGSKAIIDGLMA